MLSFLFPALGGLLFGYDIGATSGAAISLQVNLHFVHSNLEEIIILFSLQKKKYCFCFTVT